jgi:heme exporter protein C
MSDTTISGAIAAYANPARFLKLAGVLIPVIGALAALTLVVGLWMAWHAPADYQQGETVRIMFIHVPFAWLSMLVYSIMAVSALGTLVWRHPLADVAAKAALPIGATFTALCLITGALWGRPTWGTYWAWDARLTSVFVLFLIYLGLMAIHRAIDEPGRAARAAAIVTLVGALNLPIIKFSVDWWNTLHQPASVFRRGGPTIDPSMLWPLLVMAVGMTLFFAVMHLMAMRAEIWSRRASALSRRLARDAG